MVRNIMNTSFWLCITLIITACGTFSSKNTPNPEIVRIKTLQTQGLAQNYLPDQGDACTIKHRLERDNLYAYQVDSAKTLAFDANRSGTFTMRLNIQHNPFKQKHDCVKSVHRGLAPSLLRETRSGSLQNYSGEILTSLSRGDLRGLADNIKREFGS